jgi:hypothetical protein
LIGAESKITFLQIDNEVKNHKGNLEIKKFPFSTPRALLKMNCFLLQNKSPINQKKKNKNIFK